MMFYIAYTGFELTEVSGIWTKILGQAYAFEKKLGEVYCTALSNQMAYLMHGNDVVEKEAAVTRKDYLTVILKWLKKYQTDRTYIRYPFADKWFIELLKYQKDHGIRTVLEIPTYPYDGELAYGRVKVEDAYYRKMVSEYVDFIASYSKYDAIWGRKCITLVNGIDAAKYKVKRKNDHVNRITLIAVSSSMTFWNGFERIIEGMKIYKQSNGDYDVFLKLVGKGADEKYYKKLAADYGLENQVEFCGFLTGKALDDVYSQSDVAVNSLGSYKKKLEVGASLKGAEYCARGIPIVCGYTDIRFPEGCPFVLQVENNSSPLKIGDIIAFYEKVSAQDGYEEKIHDYAVKYLNWDYIMQRVIDYLK